VHELALADAIVSIVDSHARGRRVVRVEVEAGALRQVVPEALEFSFELVAVGTAAAGAELVVEEVPACVRCRECGSETEVRAFPFACGDCGCIDVEVTDGEQFQVVALEVEEVEVVGSR